MKRPTHVWAAFIICLVIVTSGMGWLTIKVIKLDRTETNSRLEADFEGDVRLALRRMDMELAEIFAVEMAWPYYAYRSFYWLDPSDQLAQSTNPPSMQLQDDSQQEQSFSGAFDEPFSDSEPVASPLLNTSNAYVNLYFQVGGDNQVASPNVPPANQHTWAAQNGTSPSQIKTFQRRLDDMQEIALANDLNASLPEVDPLPAVLAQNTAPNGDQVAAADPFSNDDIPQPQGVRKSKRKQTRQLPQQALNSRYSKEDQIRRGNTEYQNRKSQSEKRVLNYVQQQQAYSVNMNDGGQQKVLMAGESALIRPGEVLEGRSRALWADSQLLLARRVILDGEPVVQGCWLDWAGIKDRLAEEVADLLPSFEIVPVHSEAEANMGRMLATLPAEIVVEPPQLDAWSLGQGFSPMQLAVLAAWSSLLAAAIAVGLLLAGVISLSERRAAFVSAVTHELRTPLTTFRMYAEMLAEGMVLDQQKQKTYLETLKSEADRLYHLVENVLSYAKLERGRTRSASTEISIVTLIEDIANRLQPRVEQAEMVLEVELDERLGDSRLVTDIGGVEQIVVNLVDNACKYATL
ncbi:MAG: HAMP domain-containing histidine kinase, partial [Planctomycetales bacterium]